MQSLVNRRNIVADPQNAKLDNHMAATVTSKIGEGYTKYLKYSTIRIKGSDIEENTIKYIFITNN